MTNIVLSQNVYTVTASSVKEATVTVQPTQSIVVVDNARQGPTGPAGPGANTGWITFSNNNILSNNTAATLQISHTLPVNLLSPYYVQLQYNANVHASESDPANSNWLYVDGSGVSAENFNANSELQSGFYLRDDNFQIQAGTSNWRFDANGVVSLNSISLGANGYLDFDTSTYKPDWRTGRLYWDTEERTWIGYGDGSSFEISMGQREWVRCRNNSGVTIYKGQPVYITGVHIPGNPVHGHHPTIALADASDETKKDVIGLAGEDIADGLHGYVVVRGYIEGIDTSQLTSGQRVHLGFSQPGVLQTIAPEYPNWPMDVGVCLTSNATLGTLYVNINDHSVERFRVARDAVIGRNLTVQGELTVSGNVTTTAAVNLSVDSNFIYVGGGDTIATTNFVGSGLNDALFHGVYEGGTSRTFYVKIDSVGATDTFAWSYDNFATTEGSNIAITGAKQTLAYGITIQFQATTGHTLDDKWNGAAAPVNVDLGIVGNYNDGVYHHAGIFRDASDGVWKIFDNYVPEPTAAVNIDTNDASFHIANFQANTVYIGNTSAYATLNATSFTGTTNTATYVVSPVKTVNADYTVTANDTLILANAALTLTLPLASTVTGKPIEIKNINTGNVTIVGTGSDKIDGYDNMIIQFKNSMLGLKSTGSGWLVY